VVAVCCARVRQERDLGGCSRWRDIRAPLAVQGALVSLELMFMSNQIQHLARSDVSRTSNISVAAYLRTSACTSGQETHEMGNDLLVGRVDLTPTLDAHVSNLNDKIKP
jgi:hypothetical protein